MGFKLPNEQKSCVLTKQIELIKMIRNKGQSFSNVPYNVKKKYNQLAYDENPNQSEVKVYHFGIKFNYGHSERGKCGGIYDGLRVYPKYKSFKEEITKDCISTLSVEQFENEYQKSEIHYWSNYSRETFPNLHPWVIYSHQHVLALMIYCNYTELQYEFSKTYRINDGKQHNNFYHLGSWLMSAVHNFGINMSTRNVFYHGIGETLLFPKYIGWDLIIYGPLSTSTSREVAINFTNMNQGAVIQFVAKKKPITLAFSTFLFFFLMAIRFCK
eukprot:257685_1